MTAVDDRTRFGGSEWAWRLAAHVLLEPLVPLSTEAR